MCPQMSSGVIKYLGEGFYSTHRQIAKCLLHVRFVAPFCPNTNVVLRNFPDLSKGNHQFVAVPTIAGACLPAVCVFLSVLGNSSLRVCFASEMWSIRNELDSSTTLHPALDWYSPWGWRVYLGVASDMASISLSRHQFQFVIGGLRPRQLGWLK